MSVSPPSPAEVADRMAITDVLHRYCRAMDRMDRPLALSCWHTGGTDEHTPLFAGTAKGFIDWVWALHAPMIGTRHCLSNILIDVAGNDAWSESYWNVLLRVHGDDGPADITGGGRYLDHLERIDGCWAIRHRRSVHDWDRIEPVRAMPAAALVPNNPEAPVYPPRRDTGDPSYEFLGGHRRFGSAAT